MIRLLSVLAVPALLLTGCGSSEPAPPQPTAPPNFDRTFDAALAAAQDVGVKVESVDRANGRIRGMKGASGVAIDILRQANGQLKLQFIAPDSREKNPTLGDRWLQAYHRRMGR